ncbi:DUF2834 domain-containing protein [Halopseudomonas salegens]|nr:DUF2834 domain-containing protein [Halopseudomonas salegens]
MNLTAKLLVPVYVLSALLALIFTWYHVPAYLGNGALEALIAFWTAAIVDTNPASKFIVVDILFLAFVCNLWMFIEGRRLGFRYLYVYILGGALIAISVAFPLFLAARELRLAKGDLRYQIKTYDMFVLMLFSFTAVGAGVLAI